ncbi:glycosyl hydrolase [Pontiellaceae bacterium B12227]|nr:glycosyl hydrolase [Pontiellaceae bacterium B12227]
MAYGRVQLSSKKKGYGTVPGRDPQWAEKLDRLNAKWFYSWGEKAPEKIPPGIEFVPMKWGKWGCTAEKMSAIKAAGHKTLLGFNEPDQKKQANMSVEKAIELWPLLMDTGLRLGSPAGVHPDGEWMEAFMAEVKKRGYRVDFITMHSYMGKHSKHFLSKVEKIHKLYKKPIWITEFAVADWSASKDKPNKFSPDDVLKFMEKTLPALEKMDQVERYAWFSGENPPLKPSSLFEQDGTLSRLGRMYASF